MTSRAGWTETTILDATDKIMDFRGRTPKKLGMDWGAGHIPAISARNVRMGRIDFTEEYYVGSETLYRRWMTHGDMEPGDSLITTEAPLGNVAAVPDAHRYILSQRTVLLRPKQSLFDKTFFTQMLQSPLFQRLLMENATGSTALGIQRKRLEQLAIPTPPLAQQRGISRALVSVDSLINALESLTEKKQAIKQGMTQQLLTGQTRLRGFAHSWSETSLGKVARIKTGSRNNQDKKTGGRYPLFVRSATVERIDSYSYDCEAILIPGEGGIGSIFHYINGKFEVHQRVYKISDFAGEARGRFVFYFMRQFFGRHAMENSVKATVDSLRLPTFMGFEIRLPPIDEQDAIITVLDDVESELSSLKHRLTKARWIKQGMMQQLLTGRTRLVVEEGAA